jgi:Spy/CpxP family protein refolding chaperone
MEAVMKRTLTLAAWAACVLATPVALAQGPAPGKGMGPGMGPGMGGGNCVMMGAGPGMQPGKGPGPGPGNSYCWARERMYGTPLMTLEERQAHMAKMWNAKTTEERNKIRDEHHKLMLERAKAQQKSIDEKADDYFSVPAR